MLEHPGYTQRRVIEEAEGTHDLFERPPGHVLLLDEVEQTTSRLTLLVNALLHRLESDLNRGLAQAEQSVPPSFLVRRSSCP